jgi:hypothetical protein
MYFDNYEFRCSALGKIWSAKGEVTDGNKTYLNELFVGEMEGIRKEIHSKYFTKGVFMEEDGIDLLNQTLYKGKLILKNKERKHNGFIHGEADCLVGDIVYDIKNAWDRFTFGTASLTPIYEWQGRGYMWLWDKPKFRLFYCLNNMPEHLLCDEERKLFYAHYFATMEDEEYIKLCMELRKKHNYDHMKLYERFRFWEIEHDEGKIEKLKAKIIKCRGYLNELFITRQDELRRNIEAMGLDPDVILADYDQDNKTTIISAA